MKLLQISVFFLVACIVHSLHGTSSDYEKDPEPETSLLLRELQNHVKRLETQQQEWQRRQEELMDMIQQRHQHDLSQQKEDLDKQTETMRRECGQQKEELLSLIQQQRDDFLSQRVEFETELKVLKKEFAQKREKPSDWLIAAGQRHFSVEDKNKADEGTSHEAMPFSMNINATEGLPDITAVKRSDDNGALEPILSQVTQRITEMTSDIQALKNSDEEQIQARGTTYIRWGHAGCPDSSEVVYTGIVAGTVYTATGGAANHLCLTSQPTFDGHSIPSGNSHGTIHGSEYDICPESECNTTPACSVCRVPRAAFAMIPGTNTCSPGWTKEYSGYIMASNEGYSGSSEYICVDSSHGYIHASQANNDENIIRYIVAKCGALPCPPYVDEKIVTCVVCSK